ALGTRTVFASIPYFLDGFVTTINTQLQSIVDQDIFVISALAGVTQLAVQFVGDALVGVTQAVARAVAYATGSGTIAPTDPPLQPPTVSADVVLTAAQTALVTESPNLLVNPGAEFGDPSLTGNASVTVPGWTVTGTPTVIEYGTPRNAWPLGTPFAFPDLPAFMGFPTAASGPSDGGAQFFGGGNVADATLTQRVDLTAAGAAIDLGGVSYNLSGWLGGWLLNPSAASVKVNFLDTNEAYLGSTSIGPVGILERWLQTGLKERQTTGALPEGTRFADVVVNLDQCALINIGINQAYNSAFADNISFTVGADLPAPADPEPPLSAVGDLEHVYMVY
ncbi:MAG: alkaline phosphatase family protein, partial [Mycobacterium sp.]